MSLPSMPSWDETQARIQTIFPEGTPHRAYLTREVAASTVFVMLYIGAVEGAGVWVAPKHVYRMTDMQVAQIDDASRSTYAKFIMKPGSFAPGQQWYADNSREQIRDETLREALVVVGAAVEKADVATTANVGRYALTAAFAKLFDPALTGTALAAAIEAWQKKALSKGALARIAIVRKGAAAGGSHVTVTFPNGETRRMKHGPSSEITKAVIEVFATKFLKEPAVLFVSESGNKVVARDDDLAKSIGLTIVADKNLPDTILVDLEPEHPRLVFIEVVATDGPINERRKQALEKLANDAGFPLAHVAFVTAYVDRSGAPFKKTVDSLAWGSFAWFAAEPDALIRLTEGAYSLGLLPVSWTGS